MNNDIRNEMIVVLGNSNVCRNCQIAICADISRFLENETYVAAIKDKLDLFFTPDKEINLLVDLPRMVLDVITLNETIESSTTIEIEDMKYVIYGIIYNYLDQHQPIILNRQHPGDLRVIFLNILDTLLIKPKKLKITKLSIWKILTKLCCDDNNNIKL